MSVRVAEGDGRSGALLAAMFAWLVVCSQAQAQDSPSAGATTPTEAPAAPAAVPPPPPPASTSPEAVPPPPSHYAAPPASGAPIYPGGSPADATQPQANAAVPQLAIPARIATRLRVLSTDLNTLAARGGGGVADGVFSIITGGLMIGIGALFANDVGPYLAPILYVSGGSAVARGLIDVLVVPDPTAPMLDYSHMPETTVDEVKARLRFGEAALESLADRNRLARLLDGAVGTICGAVLAGLVVSQYYADKDSSDAGIYMAIGLLGATTLSIGGLIALLSRTDAERRWDAYQDLRRRLSEGRRQQQAVPAQQPQGPSLQVAPVVTAGVAMGTLRVVF